MGVQRRGRALAADKGRLAPQRRSARPSGGGHRKMKPLHMLDGRLVDFVLLDIDDTLTTGGKLGADAYAELEALQRAGKKLIAVTGRPAGWCDHIARMWPVDAVVGENGAFYFWFAEGKLGKRFIDDAQARAA